LLLGNWVHEPQARLNGWIAAAVQKEARAITHIKVIGETSSVRLEFFHLKYGLRVALGRLPGPGRRLGAGERRRFGRLCVCIIGNRILRNRGRNLIVGDLFPRFVIAPGNNCVDAQLQAAGPVAIAVGAVIGPSTKMPFLRKVSVSVATFTPDGNDQRLSTE
jgi:hypothetical protein